MEARTAHAWLEPRASRQLYSRKKRGGVLPYICVKDCDLVNIQTFQY